MLPPEAFGGEDGFEAEGGALAVLEANWDCLRAFLACGSQWRTLVAGAGEIVTSRLAGLDYAGCRAAVAALGLNWREVFGGLQAMEAEVLRSQRDAERE